MNRVSPDPAATVRAYLSALNAGDADAVAACVSEDFGNEHASSAGLSLVGRAAYRRRLDVFFAEFRDLHYEIEDLIIDGERVAVPYRMSGNWCGPGADAATSRPFSIRGMFRFRVHDGLITHRVDYWDSADFQRQVAGAR